MANIKHCYVNSYCPIKNGPGLRGGDIGKVYLNQPPVEFDIDLDTLRDNWVKIVNPLPFGPTWFKKGQAGWVELPHVTIVENEHPLVEVLPLVVDWENRTIKLG